MGTTDVLFSLLGQILAYGGGAAVVAYLLFQYLGKQWIENKFKERLDQLKHHQALELQRLRVEIDSLLSAKLKLQDREFQLLPEAWQKLDEAYGQVSWLVSPMQQYANLDSLNSIQLEEFLEMVEFTPSQKQEVRQSRSKIKTYGEIEFRYRLNKVKGAVNELHNFVTRNGIFFPAELKKELSDITETLWSALTSKEIGHEAKDYKMQGEGWKQIQETSKPLYKSIENHIQMRLASHGKRD
jgi:hypothetical protein